MLEFICVRKGTRIPLLALYMDIKLNMSLTERQGVALLPKRETSIVPGTAVEENEKLRSSAGEGVKGVERAESGVLRRCSGGSAAAVGERRGCGLTGAGRRGAASSTPHRRTPVVARKFLG